MSEELIKKIKDKSDAIDNYLQRYIERIKEQSILYAAVSYSLFPGGKRLRPILLLSIYESITGKIDEKALFPACAIELIHTYSLIHDDLPIMDNSDTRRGKPTTHKIYGDNIALLAGDAILTDAFYMLSSEDARNLLDSSTIVLLINKLSKASGITGLVEGQAFELIQEKNNLQEELISYIHEHKTATLFGISFSMGAIAANAPVDIQKKLEEAGKKFGLAFQLADDLKDMNNSESEVNYARLFGREKSIEKINLNFNDCIKIIDSIEIDLSKFKETLFTVKEIYKI